MPVSGTFQITKAKNSLVSKGEHTYKYDVKMTCRGCSGAITRALNKVKEAGDINEFSVSLDTQEVVVKTSTLDYDTVREKIAKTGKEVRSGTTVV